MNGRVFPKSRNDATSLSRSRICTNRTKKKKVQAFRKAAGGKLKGTRFDLRTSIHHHPLEIHTHTHACLSAAQKKTAR
jgi:hypothetical protein